jgi:dTDP-4-dehydrorhamnose reductase
LNEYGKSKLAGEEAVVSTNDRHLVLRLSWVFGAGTQNFIFKLAQWAEKNEYLKVACDEFSVPTFTGTVVDVTLDSLQQGVTGRFHLTNSGYCSRYEWARVVFATRGIDKFIRPVSMESFGLPAKRPGFSAMNNGAIINAAGCSIPAWDDAVRAFLQENRQL